MDCDDAPSDLYTFRHVAGAVLDWPQLYRQAVAAGCGATVHPDEERIAAVDELLALTLRELIVLAELSAFAAAESLAEEIRRPLAATCAALLRLLDSALAAHGRDNGYRVHAWRERTATTAHAIAAMLDQPHGEVWPLPAAIDRAAHRIAGTLTALGRDRVAVPERLVEAAGELLVIYAAATEG